MYYTVLSRQLKITAAIRIGKAYAMKEVIMTAIEGKLHQAQSWNPPTWWRTPEQQLTRARQLWPDAVLPKPPKEFTPRTASEVLLLHVPDTFDSLWDKIDAPEDYTKVLEDDFKTDEQNLRLAPNKVEFTASVWLAFDPEHAPGASADSFWGQPDLAASEVLSALIQFPEWPLAWHNGASVPFLSGYQLRWNEDQPSVPCLHRWGSGRKLILNEASAESGAHSWSSPTVREC